MIEKLIKAGAIVLAAAMLAACGGGSEPETEKGTERRESSSATAAAAPTKTPETEPARAQRLDHLLPSPTTKPDAAATKTMPRATDAAETKAAEKPTPAREPGETESAVAPANPRLNTLDLVPENPQTNDQVLLQDIYQQIDLGQFALDPGEPIPFVEIDGNRPNQASLIKYLEHPYLHLFPELKYIASQGGTNVSYVPFINKPHEVFNPWSWHFDLAATHSRLTYFIYNPWFEQTQYRSTTRNLPYHAIQKLNTGVQTGEPYWFGDNSTRGILAETVAKLLEEAKLPSTEPYPRDWWTQRESPSGGKYIDLESLAPREWTLEEYIRTGVQYPGPQDDHFEYEQVEFHTIPQITWEFLDPKLPILRVTAHAEQLLPLTNPASPEGPERKDYTSEHITRYSVSFVISLQNRWTSFGDPDRWILRFGEDLELYLVYPHHVDRSRGDPDYMPNYWNGDETGRLTYKTFKNLKSTLSLGYTQDTGLTYPNYWGRHRLHATPDHRAGGAHSPRVAGPPARHIRHDPEDFTMGSAGPHPNRRTDPEDVGAKYNHKEPFPVPRRKKHIPGPGPTRASPTPDSRCRGT